MSNSDPEVWASWWFRQDFHHTCRAVDEGRLVVLVDRGPDRHRHGRYPAYCVPHDRWRAACDRDPEHAPRPDQVVEWRATDARKALAGRIFLPAVQEGRHSVVTAHVGAELRWCVVFVPRAWWDA